MQQLLSQTEISTAMVTETYQRLFGKRSASGSRRRSGSSGQATDPAGAVHRLVLWSGDLSTAGARVLGPMDFTFP